MSCTAVKVGGIVYKDYEEYKNLQSSPELRYNYAKMSTTKINADDNIEFVDPINKEMAKSYLKQVFPSMSNDEISKRFKMLNVLDMMRKTKSTIAYGMFKDGVISLLSEPHNTVSYGTLKHEVFHSVFNGILTEGERSRLMSAALRENSKLSKLDPVGIEEYLADRYMNFKSDNKTSEPFIKQIFNKIKELFDFILNNSSNIDRIFLKIERGELAEGRTYNSELSTTRFMEINREFKGSPKYYRILHDQVIDRINSLMNPDETVSEKDNTLLNIPLSRQEAIAKIKEEFLNRVNELKSIPSESLTESQANEMFMKSILVDNDANKNKTSVFDHLVKDIYPNLNWKISRNGTVDVNLEDPELSEEEAESVMNQENTDFDESAGEVDTFIGKGDVKTESETIDPLKRASESVKDIISTVTYKDQKGQPRRVDPGYVFYKLIKGFSPLKLQINPNETDLEFKDRILSDIRTSILGKGATKNKNKESLQAIYNEVDRLFNQAYPDGYYDNSNHKIQFTKDHNFIWKGTNENTGSYSFQYRSSKGNLVNLPLDSFKGHSVEMFLKLRDALNKFGVKSDLNELVALYQRAEARNKLSEIYTVTGSLREKKVYKGEQKEMNMKKESRISGARFKRVYFEFANAGFSDEYKTFLLNSLRNNMREDNIKSMEKLFNNPALKTKGKYSNKKEVTDLKNEIIETFFKDVLRYGEDVSLYSDKQMNPILAAIEIIIKEFKNSSDPDIAVKNISNATKDLVNLMIDSKGLERSSSYTTSDGKTKWFFTLSNSAFNFINEVIEDSPVSTPSESLTNEHSVLANNFFNRHSPKTHRVNQTIYAISDHESTLDTSKPDVRPTQYKKETAKDSIIRNAFYQFFASIGSQSDKKSLKYFQSFYTISDKSQMSSAQINVFDNDQNKLALFQLIRSEAAVKAKSQTYNLSKKQFNSHLEDTNIEGLKEYISTKTEYKDMKLSQAIQAIANSDIGTLEAATHIFNNAHANAAQDLVDKILVDNKITFDENSIRGIKELLSHLKIKSDFDLAMLPTSRTKYQAMTEENLKDIKNFLFPAVHNFISNYYSNSYMLNQLALGDQFQYKNYIDVVKRMAGPFAIGQSMFVSSPKDISYRAVVLEDLVQNVDANMLDENRFSGLNPLLKANILARLQKSKSDYESTDAAGYAIKERMQFLRDSFGRSANIGSVTKPVYNGKNDLGITTYVKNSLVELSPELQRAFPELKVLAFQMTFGSLIPSLNDSESAELKDLYNKEVSGYFQTADGIKDHANRTKLGNYVDRANKAGFIHEAYFKSAVKTGQPNSLTKVSDIKDELGSLAIDPNSTLKLNNQDFRIQLNLRKTEIEGKVSNPTQINYFPNSNAVNDIEQQKILQRLSERISFGMEQIFRKFDVKFEDNSFRVKDISDNTRNLIKDELLKLTKGVQGSEVIADMLSEPEISVNFSVISEKVAQVLLQKFAKETTQIKHPGKKLILQSMFGTRLLSDNTEKIFNSKVKNDPTTSEPELVIKKSLDRNGKEVIRYYAEAYVPHFLKDTYNLKEGDELSTEHPAYNEMVGYRIPSTELHSAIPLKVIGFYPSAENDNVIIVPKEVVLLHGSDFDIDTLYTLNVALANKTVLDPQDATAMSIEGVPIGKTSRFTIDDNGQVSLTRDSSGNFVIEDIPNYLEDIKKTIDNYQSRDNLSKEEKVYLDDLIDLYKKGISNDILDTYRDMISSEKNIEFMMKPITQEPFENIDKSSPESTLAYVIAKTTNNQEYIDQYNKNEIDADLRDKILKGEKFLSNFSDQVKIFTDNFLAKDLTGISANYMKAIRYLFIGSQEADPQLHEDYHLKFNGQLYDKITRNQLDKNGQPIKNEFNTDIIDTIINAAIDHVKEQKLNLFDITTKNAATFMTAIAMGINITDAAFMQIQPAVREFNVFTNYDTNSPTKISNYLRDYLVSKMKSGDEVSDGKVNKYLEGLRDIELTSQKLQDAYTNKTIHDLIAEDNKEAIEFQYGFINNFMKIHKVGEAIDEFAKTVGIIQQYGKDLTDLKSTLDGFSDMFDVNQYLDLGKFVFNENYMFSNFNVENTKNVLSALQASGRIISLFEKVFFKYNKDLTQFANKIEFSLKNNTDIIANAEEDTQDTIDDENPDQESVATQDRGFLDNNIYKSVKRTVEGLLQYITTNVSYQDPVTGENRSFSVMNEKPVEGTYRTLTGFQSYEEQLFYKGYDTNTKTIDGRPVRIKALQSILEDNLRTSESNKFLKALGIKNDFKNRTEFISFMKGAIADALDRIELKEEFLKLKYSDILYEDHKGNPVAFNELDVPVDQNNIDNYFNDFQHTLLKYGVQKNGLRFGSQSYVSFISPKLYSLASKAVDSSIEGFLAVPKRLEDIQDHFRINYAVNNILKTKDLTNLINKAQAKVDPEYTSQYADKLESLHSKLQFKDGRYYNIKIPVTDTKFLENFPTFARLNNTLYVKLSDINSQIDGNVYYMKVSNANNNNISYQFNPNMKSQYFVSDHFNSKDLFIGATDIKTLGQEKTKVTIKDNYQEYGLVSEGQTIKVFNPNDFTRANPITYEIQSISEKDEDGRKVKTLDLISKDAVVSSTDLLLNERPDFTSPEIKNEQEQVKKNDIKNCNG